MSDIEFASNNLPAGKFKINIELITPNEITIDNAELDLAKGSSKSDDKVYIDKYLRTIVGGKPFFPLGMYWGSITETDLKIYSKSKFNCLMPYTSPTIEQMDLAKKYGLKVIYSLKDFFAGTKYCPKDIQSTDDEEQYIKNVVKKIKNNKALLAWYLSDELPLDFIPRIKKHRDWVLEEDQNHPIWIVQNKINEIALYRNTFDVVGTDPYPIGADNEISMAANWTRKTIEQIQNTKPVWMVPQVHNLSIYFQDKKNQTPSFEEIRNMAWQSICEGAKGLIFYSFFDLKRDPNIPFEIRWKDLKKIAEEISGLSEILLSIETVTTLTIKNKIPKWLHYLVRKKGDKIYVFTVNDGNGSGEIIFSFPTGIRSVSLYKGKKLTASGNNFKDTFNRLDVKIYEVVLDN